MSKTHVQDHPLACSRPGSKNCTGPAVVTPQSWAGAPRLLLPIRSMKGSALRNSSVCASGASARNLVWA